jgi:uncharacterized membrane protein
MNTELDLSNANALDESFSNFRLSSIKSKVQAQKKAMEEKKAKALADAKAKVEAEAAKAKADADAKAKTDTKAKADAAKSDDTKADSESKSSETTTTEDSRLAAPTSDKFLGMPKKVGIAVVAVGGLALLVGGFFLIKKMRK